MAIGCDEGYTEDLTSTDLAHDSDFDLSGGGFNDARNASDNVTTSYIQKLTYCSLDFGVGESETIRSLRLWAWNVQAYDAFKNGDFEGSNNNVDWDPLVALSTLGAPPGSYPGWIAVLEFDNTSPYRYYRISGLPWTTATILAEWEFKACVPPPALLSGTVKEKGVGVARTVRSYVRSTGVLYDSTVSQANGVFEVEAPDDTTEMYVIALDDDAGDQYNALIYDRVTGIAQD